MFVMLCLVLSFVVYVLKLAARRRSRGSSSEGRLAGVCEITLFFSASGSGDDTQVRDAAGGADE
jgi:hypothetical protein